MATKLARDFQRLRVLTSLDLRQRMDALVEDLSHALDMDVGSGGGSHLRVYKRRTWKRRSKYAGGGTKPAHHSDDSNSSFGDLVFGSQDKGTVSSMHQSDSDDLASTSVNRTHGFHPYALHGVRNTFNVAESDSFNENFTPTKSSTRRKRKFKRIAMDLSDPNTPSTSQQTIMLAPPSSKHKTKFYKPDAENRYSFVTCGKRKRSLREKSVEFDQGLSFDRLNLCEEPGMECGDLENVAASMVSSSSLSSSESDAGVYTNDEGREGDDEQSDWFYEAGPVYGVAEAKTDWEISDETSQEAEVDSSSGGREIRSGRRQLHERRPAYRINTSVNDKFSRFLRDPTQSELRLPTILENEQEQIGRLAKLYSLNTRNELHSGVTYHVFTKTRNTQRVRPIVTPHSKSQGTGDFKRRRQTPPMQTGNNAMESVDESDSVPPPDTEPAKIPISEKTSDESL